MRVYNIITPRCLYPCTWPVRSVYLQPWPLICGSVHAAVHMLLIFPIYT